MARLRETNFVDADYYINEAGRIVTADWLASEAGISMRSGCDVDKCEQRNADAATTAGNAPNKHTLGTIFITAYGESDILTRQRDITRREIYTPVERDWDGWRVRDGLPLRRLGETEYWRPTD